MLISQTLKTATISGPVVPFIPRQLGWQRDDTTFIKALATFLSRGMEFFFFLKKAGFQRVFFITISLVFLNGSYGYFLRSCTIKVERHWYIYIIFFFFFNLQGLRELGELCLKAIADIKTDFKSALTFCSQLLLLKSTFKWLFRYRWGERNPLICLVGEVGVSTERQGAAWEPGPGFSQTAV